MSWRNNLLIPQLTIYRALAPRDQRRAWQKYWSTARDDEVMWDAGHSPESDTTAARLREHADLTLPIVDLGCGNGTQSRALARIAPRVIGIDGAEAAIARANAAGGGVEYRVADATEEGLGERLHDELGDVNVHIRGMLHIVAPEARPAVVRNLAAMLGARGTAHICETNVRGNPLVILRRQGATAIGMPPILRRLIASGVRPPINFGQPEVEAHFPPDAWQVLASGPTTQYGRPLRAGGPLQEVPCYYAIVRTAPDR
ncbi:methyltransferase domain-containing protein [Dactylosporangium sp. NPDC048998]|uniref:class I SAM-dependent methyltransferase n=1 Tax=Dactylosporangium sp. NPDC048998 TaxID=3363976 RepID=UPI0037125072